MTKPIGKSSGEKDGKHVTGPKESAKTPSPKKSEAKLSKGDVSVANQAQKATSVGKVKAGNFDISKIIKSGVQTTRKITVDEWVDAVRTHTCPHC